MRGTKKKKKTETLKKARAEVEERRSDIARERDESVKEASTK